MLPSCIRTLELNSVKGFPVLEKGKYYSKMPAEIEKELPQKLADRLAKISRAWTI
jgi:hypothetical protein